MDITMFTDGSALGNPGPGGWATLLRCNGRETLLAGGCPHTTNNRMELMAVLEGLQALDHPCQITIVTDSEYVRGVLALGWKRKANQDLLAQIDRLLVRHQMSFQLVKAHNGHPENERVDAAARTQAEQARAKRNYNDATFSRCHTQDTLGSLQDTAPQAEPLLALPAHDTRVAAFNATLLALTDDLDAGRVFLHDFDPDLLARLSDLLRPARRSTRSRHS